MHWQLLHKQKGYIFLNFLHQSKRNTESQEHEIYAKIGLAEVFKVLGILSWPVVEF